MTGMNINVTVTCHFGKINPRDFVECLSSHEDLEVSVISNSKNHPDTLDIDETRVRYFSPSFSRTLYPFNPRARRRLTELINDLDTDVLISMGVGPLIFSGLAADLSPTVLVPQGGETANATGPYYWTDSQRRKFFLRRVYRPMFERLLDHVSEVWGLTEGNRDTYLNLGLENRKYRSFDWVPVDTNRYSPRGEAIGPVDAPDKTIIGTFRRIRGELILKSCLPFLEAIDQLGKKRDDFVVLLGSFYENREHDINEQIKDRVRNLSDPDSVRLQPLIPKDEMPAHYRGIDVYFNLTFPGNPLGALGTGPKEAMASGCTMVTPNHASSGPASYTIDHRVNGVLTSLDPADMVEQFTYLLENENDRRDIARRGRQRVVEAYSAESIAEQCYQYLAELA